MKLKLMNATLLLLLSFGCVSAAPGDETPAWLQQAAAIKLPTYDKEVTAAILLQDSTVTIDSDGRVNEVYNFAVRILRKEGRDYAAGHAIYIPDVSKVKELRAWLIRPSGEVKRYGKDETVDLAATLNDVYDEFRVKNIFATDDAEVGSVFGCTYAIEDRSVFRPADWDFQADIPVINSRYTLTLPPGWRAEAVTFNHSPVEPRINGSTYVWELSNLPPVAYEPLSPKISSLAARIGVSYYPPANASVPLKTFSNWSEVAAWMSELEDPQVQVDDALARKAYELTALAKSEYEKNRAIAHYVQTIQYISIQTGLGRGGGYRPHSSTEVFAKSYGDCKDKANLMRAMLKVVGISAIPVSIYSGDPTYVRANWPSPQQFNHCIIAVKINDETQASTIIKHPTLGRLLIFDPTDPETPLGDLPFQLQGSLALLDSREAKELVRAGTYPKNDALKNHVDPRTYAYIKRFFALVNVPETEFSKYRPWLLHVLLSSPSYENSQLGVEHYLEQRAKAKSKPVSGLESPKEHNAFFVDLNDRDSEALLLILFINAAREGPGADMIKAWRRGDAETVNRMLREEFEDFPSLARRLIDMRNQNWLPKIDGYLRSGQTYFVVGGAGHLGGPNGLLGLLKARGCQIEQL